MASDPTWPDPARASLVAKINELLPQLFRSDGSIQIAESIADMVLTEHAGSIAAAEARGAERARDIARIEVAADLNCQGQEMGSAWLATLNSFAARLLNGAAMEQWERLLNAAREEGRAASAEATEERAKSEGMDEAAPDAHAASIAAAVEACKTMPAPAYTDAPSWDIEQAYYRGYDHAKKHMAEWLQVRAEGLGKAPADALAERDALWMRLLRAAEAMPRATPGPGDSGTQHPFTIEAGVVWELDSAIRKVRARAGQEGA